MADSASESDSSSIDGGPIMMPPSPITREQLKKRIESLQQQNLVLKVELETYKLRVKALQEENRGLRQASVIIQAKAEQEEEFISNTLLKKIQALKKEKETLAHHYEQEEECLTNDLSRKLTQLRQEKCRLEQTLEQEQECLVNKLMRKIEKLEAETLAKQTNLEQLRREKVELENTLEQEQEALVNRLWKRMDKLEAEKRILQIKLDQPVSDPASPREINNGDTASNLSSHIQTLRGEVSRLRNQLANTQQEHTEKMEKYAKEERNIREENLRLQRKLQMEVERREALCRHLSESESSLEMEEERHYNEVAMSGGNIATARTRTLSSPVPYPSPSSSRPLSPGCGGVITIYIPASKIYYYTEENWFISINDKLKILLQYNPQLQKFIKKPDKDKNYKDLIESYSENELKELNAILESHKRKLIDDRIDDSKKIKLEGNADSIKPLEGESQPVLSELINLKETAHASEKILEKEKQVEQKETLLINDLKEKVVSELKSTVSFQIHADSTTNKALLENIDDAGLKNKLKNDIAINKGVYYENPYLDEIEENENVKIESRNQSTDRKSLLKFEHKNIIIEIVTSGKVDGIINDDTLVELKTRKNRFFDSIPKYERVQVELYFFLLNYKIKKCKFIQVFDNEFKFEVVEHSPNSFNSMKKRLLNYFQTFFEKYI